MLSNHDEFGVVDYNFIVLCLALSSREQWNSSNRWHYMLLDHGNRERVPDKEFPDISALVRVRPRLAVEDNCTSGLTWIRIAPWIRSYEQSKHQAALPATGFPCSITRTVQKFPRGLNIETSGDVIDPSDSMR
jgi:hypothetical protein